MLGEQYVSYDSDDILCLSSSVFLLQSSLSSLSHPPHSSPPSLYTQSYLNILAVSSWLGDSLWNMVIKNPFVWLQIWGCISEFYLLIYLSICLLIYYVYTHFFCYSRNVSCKDLVLYTGFGDPVFYKMYLSPTSCVHTHTHTQSFFFNGYIFLSFPGEWRAAVQILTLQKNLHYSCKRKTCAVWGKIIESWLLL